MTAKEAIRTSGFYGLWLMLLLQISSGIAVIATATKLVTKWSGYQLKWTACW
jgi:OFA family oxalate/formate antiporter-like MFS transporter